MNNEQDLGTMHPHHHHQQHPGHHRGNLQDIGIDSQMEDGQGHGHSQSMEEMEMQYRAGNGTPHHDMHGRGPIPDFVR